MKLKALLTSFAAIVILSSIATAQSISLTSTPAVTFNKDLFDRKLRSELNPNVMGYSYVLLKKGQVVSEYAYGKAQTAADGNIPFTVNTPTNIGSLAKFLSGTAMLGLMQQANSPGHYDAGLSLNTKLDRQFWTVMPSVWVGGNKPGIENISFRQLLQHRSGFDTDKASDRTVLGYLKDSDGFLPEQFDDREYANINYALNGYLLPLYNDAALKSLLNSRAQNLNFNEAQADADAKQLSGMLMHNLMKSRIWDKMTPKILPNCDAANTLQNVAAYGYLSKTDAAPGQITSMIDKQGHCGGHGGYFLSARGLANYVAHVAATDLIVNQEARDLMHTDAMAPEDRLVWSFNWKSNYLSTNFNMPNMAWSNGVAGGYRTIVAKFPRDYYLVLVTNSPDMSASALMQSGVNAFAEATKHNFE
jgi:CubicO group peptidase (beta-lactamase class C family)